MSIGSGISAQLGIATETTPGTPVAVTRFVEFDSETMAMKKHTVQGAGLRGGSLVKRGIRRNVVAREAAGDIAFDVPTNGIGLFLQHMLGSFSATATSIGGGMYQQIHNIGSLQGKAFTLQIVKPDTSGTLSADAFTYPGCKVSDWELSVQQQQQLKLKLTLDAIDEATPSNSFAPTTLSAAATAGAASISTAATIPAGSYIMLGNGLTEEVVQTGTPSGTGPFTIPITSAGGLTYAHASGSSVSNATGVNYGAVTALQASSFNASAQLFDFSEGSLIIGGTTSNVSGVWTNTGGQVAGLVRSVTVKGQNPMKVDRWGLGSKLRQEQLENNWRNYTADVEVEFTNPYLYDIYAADAPLALVLKFVGQNGSTLQFYMPVGFQNDGTSPAVSGPDIILQKLAFDILDDGVNGALQAVFTSTDTVL